MGRRVKDLTGQRFGLLQALEEDEPHIGPRRNRRKWVCACDCGQYVSVLAEALTRGFTRSCGCLNGSITHNLSNHPLYGTWSGMKQRCFNANNPDYPSYGGRGITVCDEWKNSFEVFLADMGERPEGMTLDRIDPDGNYEPSNCRWADAKTQAANKRRKVAA